MHPDNHLMNLWSINSEVVLSKLVLMAEEKGEDLEGLLIHLGRSIPRFSATVFEFLRIDKQH